jgi:HEPN domain-containing protein
MGLKALLIKRLGIYRRTHSVEAILEEISSRIGVPEDLAKTAGKLDRYYTH